MSLLETYNTRDETCGRQLSLFNIIFFGKQRQQNPQMFLMRSMALLWLIYEKIPTDFTKTGLFNTVLLEHIKECLRNTQMKEDTNLT